MLVYGQTFMGRKRSSYDYTMGFGVSAQGDVCTALQSVTPPPYLFNKIKWLSRIIKFKLSPLERGTSEIRGLRISKNNEDALFGLQAVLRHDRFIIRHDSWCAGRRLL